MTCSISRADSVPEANVSVPYTLTYLSFTQGFVGGIPLGNAFASGNHYANGMSFSAGFGFFPSLFGLQFVSQSVNHAFWWGEVHDTPTTDPPPLCPCCLRLKITANLHTSSTFITCWCWRDDCRWGPTSFPFTITSHARHIYSRHFGLLLTQWKRREKREETCD